MQEATEQIKEILEEDATYNDFIRGVENSPSTISLSKSSLRLSDTIETSGVR